MAKFDTPYDRVRKLPKQFKALRDYDAECRRGVAHTPEYDDQNARAQRRVPALAAGRITLKLPARDRRKAR
jgi:hypothetical protein